MAILVNGVKVAGVGVPGTNGKDATINGVNALTVEGIDPIVAQMVGSALQISLSGDIGGAKVETGSYVGTGTYGSGNENTITAGFNPVMVVVGKKSSTGGTNYASISIFISGQEQYISIQTAGSLLGTYLNFSSKTVSWYADNAARQMNESNVTYYWAAIG